MIADTLALVNKESFHNAKPLRIVLIDDEEWRLELWQEVISRFFHNVTAQSFQNPEKGWDHLSRTNPDLLITDDIMDYPMGFRGDTANRFNGEDIVRRLAERKVTYSIIVFSGWDGPETQQWVSEYAARGLNVVLHRYLQHHDVVETFVRVLEAALKISRDPNALAFGKRELEEEVLDEDAGVLYQRGLDFYHGNGKPVDFAAAAKFIRRAAEKSLVGAQYSLGVLLENGRGLPKDYVEAVKWYRLAAEQGNSEAQNNLGWMLTEGLGVPRDDAEAVEWFRRAALQGNARGQFNLGWHYTTGEGVQCDLAEGALWYRKAAEHGLAIAQFWFGTSCHDGRGVPKDHVNSAKWFHRAAEQGHARAQRMLGLAYLTGEGVRRDDFEAYKWLRISVELGCQDDTGALVIASSSFRAEELHEAERWVEESKLKFTKQG
jgi:TPR repeat protein